MTITLVELPKISQGDVETFAINCTDWLDSGELLTGTPTAVEQTTSDLTVDNVAVSTGSLTIKTETVATGAAIQGRVSGQLAATGVYSILVTCSTDATPARTLSRLMRFEAV